MPCTERMSLFICVVFTSICIVLTYRSFTEIRSRRLFPEAPRRSSLPDHLHFRAGKYRCIVVVRRKRRAAVVVNSDGFVNLVTVDVQEYAKTHFEKSVKKTLSIPAWLNAAALEKNINFSQVLQEALLQKIKL